MNIRRYWPFAAVAGLFFVLGILRLNDCSLYTDSTRYLIWGNSVAHFHGYVDNTQPIPNQFVMNAPLYPLLLAPVEIIFPLSLPAAKVWTLLWGVAALMFLSVWLLRYFRDRLALLIILVLALNPLFLTLSTEVLSEAPFFALAAIILLAFDVYRDHPDDRTARLALFIGLAVATLLREVGAAFVLASLIIIFRLKRGRDLLIVGLSAGILFLAWALRNNAVSSASHPDQVSNVQYLFGHFATAPGASLMSEFATRAWLNLKGYLLNVGGQILFPFPGNLIVGESSVFLAVNSTATALRIPLGLALLLLSLLGVRADLRSSPTALWRLLVAAIYCFIILLYPVHDLRFLLPLLPLILFYSGRGLVVVNQWIGDGRAGTVAGAVLFAVIIAPNAIAVSELVRTNLAYRNAPEEFSNKAREAGSNASFYDHPWSVLGSWVDKNLPEHVTIASPVKEAVPYLGKRLLLETSRVLPTPVFERTVRDFNAQYLITTRIYDDVQTFEFDRRETRRLRFKRLYAVAGVSLYEIRSAISDPSPPAAAPLPDTSTARGLLLHGRDALFHLRYNEALDLYNRALVRDPTQPEIVYQLMTTLAILGDSVAATHMNHQLFTLPQSTAYTQLAQAQLGAMSQLLTARRVNNAVGQAYAAFEAGLAYWGLGYPYLALRIMRRVVEVDSTNFVGALWATYMSQQLGDTTASNGFLARLTIIDRKAPIVKDWHDIRDNQNALRTARTPADRARLHRRIAAIYGKIELFDDALDELERAVNNQPGDVDTWLRMAEVYEKKGALVGMRNAYKTVLELEPHNSFARAKLDTLQVEL